MFASYLKFSKTKVENGMFHYRTKFGYNKRYKVIYKVNEILINRGRIVKVFMEVKIKISCPQAL